MQMRSSDLAPFTVWKHPCVPNLAVCPAILLQRALFMCRAYPPAASRILLHIPLLSSFTYAWAEQLELVFAPGFPGREFMGDVVT